MKRLFILVILAFALLTACGGDSDPASGGPGDTGVWDSSTWDNSRWGS
ncbi:MAG: hypothetical protein V1874_02815 [Spirochaetota bacterium]